MNYNRMTPEGQRDILLGECKEKRRLEERLRELYESLGYEEVMTPLIEYAGVFSEATPTGYMYKQSDKFGRTTALRCEMTSPIARLAATRLSAMTPPIKLHSCQSIYRNNRSHTGRSDEITQSGVEFIGESGLSADLEMLGLAASALDIICGDYQIEIGHSGFLSAILSNLKVSVGQKEELRVLIEQRRFPELSSSLGELNSSKEVEVLMELPSLFGGAEVLERAQELYQNDETSAIIKYLQELLEHLKGIGLGGKITVDLGLVGPLDYYTGVIFKGYGGGIGEELLSGGRYDNLLEKFGRPLPAIGFAINITAALAHGKRPVARNTIRIAVTKGRLENEAVKLLERIGYDCSELHDKGRRLVLKLKDSNIEVVLAKAGDVITYIENGVCDVGFVGKDTIMECGGSYFELLDLGISKCRFALAAPVGTDFYEGFAEKVVATKYPGVAGDFFRAKGIPVKLVKIDGSVELAPILNLSDGIVDIVETGATLKENGLEVKEFICDISARVIVNIASLKTKKKDILDLVRRLGDEKDTD